MVVPKTTISTPSFSPKPQDFSCITGLRLLLFWSSRGVKELIPPFTSPTLFFFHLELEGTNQPFCFHSNFEILWAYNVLISVLMSCIICQTSSFKCLMVVCCCSLSSKWNRLSPFFTSNLSYRWPRLETVAGGCCCEGISLENPGSFCNSFIASGSIEAVSLGSKIVINKENPIIMNIGFFKNADNWNGSRCSKKLAGWRGLRKIGYGRKVEEVDSWLASLTFTLPLYFPLTSTLNRGKTYWVERTSTR